VIAHGKIAVRGKVPWDGALDGVINECDTQRGMVFEFSRRTGLPLLGPAPFNRIMRSRCTYTVRDDVIVRTDVPLVGMIPAPPDVLNQLAFMIHQGIVDGASIMASATPFCFL
jgi:hypothetical protein